MAISDSLQAPVLTVEQEEPVTYVDLEGRGLAAVAIGSIAPASRHVADRFTRVYADRTYLHATTVSHLGKVIAFALDDQQRVYYTVLDLDRTDVPPSYDGPAEDRDFWDTEPRELLFPRELDRVGFDVGGPFPMPVVTRSGSIPLEGSPVEQADVDPFLSSTARLTAEAPFQVLSDGELLYVVRQSIAQSHPRIVYVQRSGGHVPVVDGSLLVDVFVLTGHELLPKREARFQRSRNRSLPAGPKDTMGPEDLEQKPFIQPTHELPFVRHLKDGRFTLVLVPTALPDTKRWVIFAYNERREAIDVFDLEQGADGSFDTRGLLVPLYSHERAAGSCLRFEGKGAVICDQGMGIDLRNISFTVELWAKRKDVDQWHCVISQGEKALNKGLHIGFRRKIFTFDFCGNGTDTKMDIDDKWHHWACVYVYDAKKEKRERIIYCDGEQAAKDTGVDAFTGTGPFLLGRASWEDWHPFQGDLDEVRVWSRARSQAEIQTDMHNQLLGCEPGLIAYWRLDEGQGTKIYDLTESCQDGKFESTGTVGWGESKARVGPHPGVGHARLRFKGLKVASGLSAVLYTQQESARAGYEGQAEPMKRAVRLMLAAATVPEPEGAPPATRPIAVLDMGVSSVGRPAELPEIVALAPLTPNGRKDLPMPLIGFDSRGLSTYGAKLDFAGTSGTLPDGGPQLFDAADRRVGLYFRGEEDRLFAARYDTDTARASLSLPTKAKDGKPAKPVRLVARTAGPALDGAVIEVVDEPEKPDLCKVTVTVQVPGRTPQTWRERKETWEEVPRTASLFADVINGLAPRVIETVGELEKEASGKEVTSLNLKQGLTRALKKGAHLKVGQSKVKLAAEAEKGAKNLTIEKADLTSPAGSLVKLWKEAHSSHSRASLLFQADATQAHGDVQSGKVRESTKKTPGCRWQSDAPGTALHFNPQDEKLKGVILGVQGQEAAARFSRKRDLTLEAWVRPEESMEDESFLITQAPIAGGGYALGLRRRLKAALRFNHGGPGKTDRIEVPHDSILSQPSFTLSAWARVMGGDKTDRCVVVFRDNFCGFALYADLRGKWSLLFGARKDDGSSTWDSLDCEEVSLNRWVHLAFTVEGKKISAYVNGGLRKTKEIKEFVPVPADRKLPFRIGAGDYEGRVEYPFVGDVAEVCYWKEALSAEAIADNWSRRLSLDEMEDPSLVGYWSFDKLTGNKIPNLAKGKEKLEGEVQGSLPKQIEHHPEPFAAVGGHLARSSRFVPLQRWSHVAGVYRQAHALGFQGKGYVDCGTDKSLDLTGDLTLEASFRVQDVTKYFPIAVKGLHGHGAEGEKMPYALWLKDKHIVFAFVDERGCLQSFRSTPEVPADGGIHRVAVTRETISSSVAFWINPDKLLKAEVPVDIVKKLVKIKGGFTSKRLFLRAVQKELGDWDTSRYQSAILSACRKPSDSGVTGWTEISLRLDDKEAELHEYRGASPGSSDRPLEIGRSGSANAGQIAYTYATGEIGESRLWNVACSDVDLSLPRRLTGREKGLVSWWPCTEGEGPVIRDVCGGLVGTCHGVAWTPWDEASQLELLVDGELDRNTEPGKDGLPDRPQLTLGARLRAQAQSPDRHFTGQLDEVRIWSTARSPQEIRENLYRHLTDEREHLIAYYDGEATKTAQVYDSSAYGHSLTAARPEKAAWFSGQTRVKFIQPTTLGQGALWELWFQPDPKVTDKGRRPVLWMEKALQVFWDPGLKEVGVGGFFEGQWLYASKAGIDPQVWTHVAGVAQGKALRLYVNGKLVPEVRSSHFFSPQARVTPWFLGAVQEVGGTMFTGWVREVRLWKQESQEQENEHTIRDLMTRRLEGTEKHLLGWWPLNSITHDGWFPDGGPNKIDGRSLGMMLQERLRPVSDPDVLHALYVPSSAPVGHDAPQVKGALSGIATDFHCTVGSRPSVREYGRAEFVSGDLAAVLKRCYTWLQGGAWHLLTGFKVGDLDVEWLGQVQTRPQLIGFIEGAPPVPAENFKPETRYPEASSIKLTEAEDTVQTYSRSNARNLGLSLKFKGGVGLESKSATTTGVGFWSTLEETKLEIGAAGSLSVSGDWLDSRQVSLATGRNKLSELHLTGTLVDREDEENKKKYKKFEAHNVGIALVQSETADLFALRLRHPRPERRSLVALTVRPNNEIPKDWNLLTFRINPRYTKQGELDGRKEKAREGSYFRPREAYALKARIAREEEQIRALYETFSTDRFGWAGLGMGSFVSSLGAVGTAAAGLAMTISQLVTILGQDLPKPWKRNIVNTYVWTAAGGLFQETERTMDVRQEVYRGEWAGSGSFGSYLKAELAFSKSLASFELEAQTTGGLKLTTEKSQSSQTAFGVDVSLQPEKDVLDAHGRPLPGSVDAYRFMTFYLSPKEDHFTELFGKVIDPTWLAEDQSADAVTLRQLRAEGLGAPWRVLHRVTFVSRGVPKETSDDVEKALQIAQIESNYALIRILEPFVRDKVQDYEAFRKAASDAIRLYLPELDTDNVRERVIDYLGFYFDVVRAS